MCVAWCVETTHNPLGPKGSGQSPFSVFAIYNMFGLSYRLELAPLHTYHCSWSADCPQGFHCNWSCTFTNSFPVLHNVEPHLLSMTPSILQLSSCLNQNRVGDSYTFTNPVANMSGSLGSLQTTVSMGWPWGKHFPDLSQWFLSLLDHSWLFSFNWPDTTDNTKNTQMALRESLRNSQTSELSEPGYHYLHCSQLSKFSQQLIRLWTLKTFQPKVAVTFTILPQTACPLLRRSAIGLSFFSSYLLCAILQTSELRHCLEH